jgi:hypothetical protein
MPTALTTLQFDIARAAPSLWKKAQDRQLTAREQRLKLLDLLVWMVAKQGYTAKQRWPIQYWQDSVKKDGKIDLVFCDAEGAPVLALELDWSRNPASFYKLQAASVLDIPVLGVSGLSCATKENAKELRAFANAAMGKPTGWWLPLFHLEHGWV